MRQVNVKKIVGLGAAALLFNCSVSAERGGPFKSKWSPKNTLSIESIIVHDGEILENVTVKMFSHNEDYLYTAQTDNQGLIPLTLRLNDKYTIIFEKEGMITKKVEVDTNVPRDMVWILRHELVLELQDMAYGVDLTPIEGTFMKIKYNCEEWAFTPLIEQLTMMELAEQAILEKASNGFVASALPKME